ncbi:zinc-ribbon domain-containing protein [Clostridium chrysemydis]|uniref:zinc-ribbon domain-containing protein n=1 Tax=Clostridium chrysemydis TaxID=2665504 RepID=UPI0018842534|nr:zinc ribbon domain-containing protein [Clostridium chrysemydis]
MFCRECGETLKEGSKFCIKCGCVVDEGSEIAATQRVEREYKSNDYSTDDINSKFGEYAKSTLNEVKSGNAFGEIKTVIFEILKNPIRGSVKMFDEVSEGTVKVMCLIVGLMPILSNILNPPREFLMFGSTGDIDFTQLLLRIIGGFVSIGIAYGILTLLIDKDKKKIGQAGVIKIYALSMMPAIVFALISLVISFILGLLIGSLSGLGFFSAILLIVGKVNIFGSILFGASVYSILENKGLSNKAWIGILVLIVCIFAT